VGEFFNEDLWIVSDVPWRNVSWNEQSSRSLQVKSADAI